MRRRLQKFLPIVLIALTVQIFAPIAACWAAGIAASDPSSAAPICSGGAPAGHSTGHTGEQRAHDGACSLCCLAHAALPVKTASGMRTADLADALVVNKAKITAQHRNEPYGGTYTYDQAALALEGTKAP